MQELAKGQGVVVTYYPSGPLLDYMPDKVKTVPTTAEELLAWTKENPNELHLCAPGQFRSGPHLPDGPALPPRRQATRRIPPRAGTRPGPISKELRKNIEYYPAGTGALMKELGEGTRDMTVSTTGWDINPRVLGVVPKEAKVAALEGLPLGGGRSLHVRARRPARTRDSRFSSTSMTFLLSKEQQAYTYDEGYFYPGPAVKDVTLDMAPPESQAAIKEFGRPEYEKWIADNPIELPLQPDQMVVAFRAVDEQVGGAKRQ